MSPTQSKNKMLRFDENVTYGDLGQFLQNQVVDISQTRLTETDAENLVKLGSAHYMSEDELEFYRTSPMGENMWNTYAPSKGGVSVPVHEQDVVIQKSRGVDMGWPDPREKGPAEASSPSAAAKNTKAMQQWRNNPASQGQTVERLPHNVHPTGTPLGVYTASEEAVKKLAKKAIVGNPVEIDRNPTDLGDVENVHGTTGQPIEGTSSTAPARDNSDSAEPFMESQKSTKTKK